MVEDDLMKLTSVVGTFCILDKRECTPALVEIFFNALLEHSIEDVEAAANYWIQRGTGRFPQPADLLRILDPPDKGADLVLSIAAWATFKRVLQYPEEYKKLPENGAIRRVVNLFGGKSALSKMPLEQLEFYRGDFQKAYSALVSPQERAEGMKLLGLGTGKGSDFKRLKGHTAAK